MNNVKFYTEQEVPLEFHRVKVVQKLNLLPLEARMNVLKEAGYNSYRMQSSDVYLDMLTDSGTNAMSDRQLGAMMWADDAYAGCTSFTHLEDAVHEIIGKKYVIPSHQGRAAEHTLMTALIKKGDVIPMNYHFGTSITQIQLAGGQFVELVNPEKAFKSDSDDPFKGNVDIPLLEKVIREYGAEKIPYIRMEASTNLIGGQPFSIANLREVHRITREHGIRIILDATLCAENAYLVMQREEEFRHKSLRETFRAFCDLADIVYFSARKLGFAKGAVIATDSLEEKYKMDDVVATYEGFINYGGMSTKEIEAIAVGLYEAMDVEYTSQSPDFIKYFVDKAVAYGIPMVTPPGVLGAQIDAQRFCEHLSYK
ncbi:MAG: tryptophanase, partial [Alistipes sp.]|nr:tryptophanase [Candidatus Minthomonas equi]